MGETRGVKIRVGGVIYTLLDLKSAFDFCDCLNL